MARESLVLRDEATGERFEFPVNPESISVIQGRTFREVPVINLDSVMLAGNLVPVTLSWESFFPAFYDASYCNYRPESPTASVRRIEKWLGRRGNTQVKPVPLRAVITGSYFSRLMVVTDFETEHRGGEPGDVYFSITLQSWRQQTIRIHSPSPSGKASSKSGSRPKPSVGSKRSHKVVKGDTLWAIAKKYYGDGSKWPTIYNANKAVVGSNPNLIKPGQVLVIP